MPGVHARGQDEHDFSFFARSQRFSGLPRLIISQETAFNPLSAMGKYTRDLRITVHANSLLSPRDLAHNAATEPRYDVVSVGNSTDRTLKAGVAVFGKVVIIVTSSYPLCSYITNALFQSSTSSWEKSLDKTPLKLRN